MHRRQFIINTSLAAAAIAFGQEAFGKGTTKINLSFSTLGCPKWDLPTVINFAAAHGYQGIELRVLAGELNLPDYPDFSAGNIGATKRLIRDKKLVISDIGSSCQLHHTDTVTVQKNLDEAKQFIELAHKLDCKYIRVFPEKLLAGSDKQKSLDTIANNLNLLGIFAKGSNVSVLIESHGDLVHADDLQYVMQHAANNNTGMIWDIVNMWAVTKEPPAAVFKKLSKYIFHVHVKDATFINNKEQYVLVGKGDAPIAEAVHALYQSGYKGFYSFEWEKLWHPEIEEPEIAIAAYPEAIKNILNKNKVKQAY